MILWLNGPFGVGKTTTTRPLLERLDGWRSFDPEQVGSMLRAGLSDQEPGDFQHLPPWRTLVPAVLAEVAAFTGSHLVAPQTVLVEDYWRELSDGLRHRGPDVLHVVLDAAPGTLEERIRADDVERSAERWRLAHLARYEAAREWLLPAADLVVDAGTHSAVEVAGLVHHRLSAATR